MIAHDSVGQKFSPGSAEGFSCRWIPQESMLQLCGGLTGDEWSEVAPFSWFDIWCWLLARLCLQQAGPLHTEGAFQKGKSPCANTSQALFVACCSCPIGQSKSQRRLRDIEQRLNVGGDYTRGQREVWFPESLALWEYSTSCVISIVPSWNATGIGITSPKSWTKMYRYGLKRRGKIAIWKKIVYYYVTMVACYDVSSNTII